MDNMQRREMIRSCGCGRARSPRYPPLPPPLPPPSFSPRFSPQRYVSRVTSRREMFSINPVLRMTVVPYTSGVADSPVPSASDRAIGGNPPTPPPLFILLSLTNPCCHRCCYSSRRIRIPSDGGTESLNFSTGTVYYIIPGPFPPY